MQNEFFTLLGWGCLLGGLPLAGYYLYRYGRVLMQRRRELPFDPFTRTERLNLWRKEIEFGIYCSALAGFGVALCKWLSEA